LVAEELILFVRGAWVPFADFQVVVGRIIATGLKFVPESDQAEARTVCLEMLDDLVAMARPKRAGDPVLRGDAAMRVYRECTAEVVDGIRADMASR
jgi:hypothetical protein